MSARDDYSHLAAYAEGRTRSWVLTVAEAGAALDEIDRLRTLGGDGEAPKPDLLEPADDPYLTSYYFGFDATGVGVVDRILEAVCRAGKAYHSTEMWNDPWDNTEPSERDLIQNAANASAAAIRATLSGDTSEADK